MNEEKALRAFKEYVKKYNPENERIRLKIEHIQRVARIAKQIAEEQKLSQEDVELAWLIGLLHDIGRFEQVRIYNTFNDGKSINHGEFGVKVLFEDGLIREFIDEDKYDPIIKTAILNHNRAKIEDGLNEKELLHSKIIRDADKVDIFYILTIYSKEAIWDSSDLSNERISDEIYREFKEDRIMQYKNRKSAADMLVCHFAYAFDFNFKISLKLINENGYLKKLYERHKFNDVETMRRYNDIYTTAEKYVQENCK